MADDILEAAKAVGAALTVLLVVAFVLASIWGATSFGGALVDEAFGPSTESYETYESIDSVETVEVSATTGHAAAFSGAEDSSLELGAGVDPDTSWTIAATAWLDDPTVNDSWMDVVVTDDGNVSLQYGAGQWVAYYRQPETNLTTQTRIDAVDPTSATSIVARWNGTHLSLTDGTRSNATQLDSASESRAVSWGWDGRIDEIRLANATLNDTLTQRYVSQPVAPLDPDAHTARVMADEGSGSTTAVYYYPGSATLQNASWGQGVDGPTLANGTDYETTSSPFGVRALQGGFIANAPVAYVSAGAELGVWGSAAERMMEIGAGALVLMVVGALALVASVLYSEFRDFGGGGR